MKKLVLASLLALGLSAGYAYAENKAAVELEHANKTAPSAESVAGDMSKMKAAGKCGAEQSGKAKKNIKRKAHKPTKAELELEHANKLSTGDDGVAGEMGDMKAQGKCGSN
jgi:Skp family chaperone for outer membrane proteins